MQHHHPRGARLTALEKNVLKGRALEMVLVLFYVEDLKHFLISLIGTNSSLQSAVALARAGLQKGAKGEFRAIWQVLVEKAIISNEESLDIQRLIDYRNLIAHQTQQLTRDIGRNEAALGTAASALFEPKALLLIQHYRSKIITGIPRKYIFPATVGGLMFDAAEKTYKEELRRLRDKIKMQLSLRMLEVDEINSSIRQLPPNLLSSLEPGHPRHIASNGKLTESGLACSEILFAARASPLAVAHLMRISLRATNARYRAWRARKRNETSPSGYTEA